MLALEHFVGAGHVAVAGDLALELHGALRALEHLTLVLLQQVGLHVLGDLAAQVADLILPPELPPVVHRLVVLQFRVGSTGEKARKSLTECFIAIFKLLKKG